MPDSSNAPPEHARLSVPLLPQPCAGRTIEDYGRECAQIGIYNERAAVLIELDCLAREFDAAGRANTAKRIREAAAKIESRLRDGGGPDCPDPENGAG